MLIQSGKRRKLLKQAYSIGKDNMDSLERPSVSEVILNPFLWPVPGIVVGIMVLMSSEMWKAVDVVSNHGRTVKTVPAHDFMLIIGGALAVYYISFIPVVKELVGYGHTLSGMRAASDTEKGCAVSIVRYMVLFAFYLIIFMHVSGRF